MAAAAGKAESVSPSLFVEVNDLEVEEDLSTVATLFWKRVDGQMEKGAAKRVEEADL